VTGLTAEQITAALGTHVVGRHVVVRAKTDSTNALALHRAGEPNPEGAVILAETQTAGRGRLGRTWADLPGGCLLFSVLLRALTGAEGLLTVAAALAVAEAVRDQLSLDPRIKWPNDLVLGGRKFGGVLAEPAGDGLFAVGVGVNVTGCAADLPPDLAAAATFLSEHTDAPVDRLSLLRAILRRLDEAYLALHGGRAGQLIERAQALDCVVGSEVCLVAAGKEVRGVALGWGPTGALVIRDRRGHLHEFQAGDATLQQ
jgi:BirA family biotin operon repressor/biotin-[acetyl-CoA-carboxylase] ligase